MPTLKLTHEIIAAAIEGYEVQKRRIDEQIAVLRQMLNPEPAAEAAKTAPKKRRRRMSAAGRKAIGDAARKRWAAIRAQKAQAEAAAGSKTSRRKKSTATA